ncbi:hypothetical protein [Allofournierella sp.]|uniref:hypothetical protein n=1 Tax=Allofournierella sp. TaxID=1940256 RepID=UPI003AB8D69F
MDPRCTVLVSSCDDYKDIWNVFFTLFKKFWPDCPYPIVLNTEATDYSCEGLDITIFHFDKNAAWGKRLKNALKKINSPYVIMLLDDFFFDCRVDQKQIDQCIRWMEHDRNIVNFSFQPDYYVNIADDLFEGYELRKSTCPFLVNCQAGIWNRKQLIDLVKSHEDPWQFEVFGTIRARGYKRKKRFYVATGKKGRVFTYPIGGGIHRGQWTKDMPALLSKHAITEIDYSRRGFITEAILPDPEIKDPINPSWFKRSHSLKRYIKNWRSYLR